MIRGAFARLEALSPASLDKIFGWWYDDHRLSASAAACRQLMTVLHAGSRGMDIASSTLRKTIFVPEGVSRTMARLRAKSSPDVMKEQPEILITRPLRERLPGAFAALVTDTTAEQTLRRFHAAFTYRCNFPGSPEAQDRDDPLGTALKIALDAYSFEPLSPEEVARQPHLEEPDDRSIDPFKAALIKDLPHVVQDRYAVARFANALAERGHKVDRMSDDELQRELGTALSRYAERADLGTSTEPW